MLIEALADIIHEASGFDCQTVQRAEAEDDADTPRGDRDRSELRRLNRLAAIIVDSCCDLDRQGQALLESGQQVRSTTFRNKLGQRVILRLDVIGLRKI